MDEPGHATGGAGSGEGGPVAVTVVAGGPEAAELAHELAAFAAPGGVCFIGPQGPTDALPVEGLLPAPAEAAIGYRTTGCECCSMRVDVIDGVRLALLRRRRPRRALVVTHHDAVGVAQTLLTDPDLRDEVFLDAVVATCDGPAMATRLATAGRLGTREELATLAMADAVVVARADRLRPTVLGRVRHALRCVNRSGPVRAWVGGPAVFGALVDRRAWHGRMREVHDFRPAPDGAPATVVVGADRPLAAEGARAWLDEVADDHASQLLRLQGELCLVDRDTAVDCVGLRSVVVTQRGRKLHDTTSQVTLVGWGLDRERLAAGLRSRAPR